MNKNLLFLFVSSIVSGLSAQEIDGSNFQIVEKEIIVLREKCFNNTFSFCSDGYEQPYRMYPYFVFSNSSFENLENIYANGVCMFVPQLESDSLAKKGIEFKDGWILDSLVSQNISLGKEVFIYSKALAKKVKCYYRKNNIQRDFEGRLLFDTYKLKVKYLYAGKRKILLPNMRRGCSLVYGFEVDVYYILDIS